MRIWDIHPGYLDNQDLDKEHAELHSVVMMVAAGQKGFRGHPEAIRWSGYGWALKQRHAIIKAEMALRGIADNTLVLTRSNPGTWPEFFYEEPFEQFETCEDLYRDKSQGRIPLPQTAQQLWAQHKYSVLARSQQRYRAIGRKLAEPEHPDTREQLANELTLLLRKQPSAGGLRNAIEHMWGHVSDAYDGKKLDQSEWSNGRLLRIVQQLAIRQHDPYLLHSTALSELDAWI